MNPIILICEDNDTIRNLLVIALEHRGWKSEELIVCLDAESADTVLKYTAVDCIVSDYDLGPAKMTGIDLFDRWAHQYVGRFFLHTGSPLGYLPTRRAVPVIQKPADITMLVALIRAAAAAASPKSPVPRPKSGHRTTDTGLRTASVSLASDFGPRAGIQPPTQDSGLRTTDLVI